MAAKDGAERFWRDAKKRWRRTKQGKGAYFSKAPTGVYLDKAGRWRDARAGHKFAPKPARARKPAPEGHEYSTRRDHRAIERMVEILQTGHDTEWTAFKAPPIADRYGNVSFRSVYELEPDGEDVHYDDIAVSLETMVKDKLLNDILGGRRILYRVRAKDEDGDEHDAGLAFAFKFSSATTQAAGRAQEYARRYGLIAVEAGFQPRDFEPSVIQLLSVWFE